MDYLTGILGIKRGRKKDKKAKKSSASIRDEELEGGSKDSATVGSDGEDTQKSATPTPEVDEEGFSKPPSHTSKIGMLDSDPWADFNRYQTHFCSSSDESGKFSKPVYLQYITVLDNRGLVYFLTHLEDHTFLRVTNEIKISASNFRRRN